MQEKKEAGVVLGLGSGVEHQVVPGAGGGGAGAAAGGFGQGGDGELFGDGFAAAGLAGLLGFEDEGGAFVEVDAAGGQSLWERLSGNWA